MDEVKEEIGLIKEIYDPEEVGWVVLDYRKEKFILSGQRGFLGYLTKNDKTLGEKDKYFRRPDEIPENYKWDLGEYDGWLRYRWGDGKNAIGYKEPCQKPKRNHEPMTEEEIREANSDTWD